jgi:hypothetical protein
MSAGWHTILLFIAPGWLSLLALNDVSIIIPDYDYLRIIDSIAFINEPQDGSLFVSDRQFKRDNCSAFLALLPHSFRVSTVFVRMEAVIDKLVQYLKVERLNADVSNIYVDYRDRHKLTSYFSISSSL